MQYKHSSIAFSVPSMSAFMISLITSFTFATYLGIPVANIQNWEQGVNNPPNYVVSLISRVMKNDGYIEEALTPVQVDAIRQVQATLAIEGLSLTGNALSMMKRMAAGEVSYDDAIADLKRKYQNDENY